jgi:uncharacterized protein YceK
MLNARHLTCLLMLAALLSGCGLAGTATGTAAGSAAEVEQARQAKQIEAQAQQRLDDARRADDARRTQAEKDAR